MKIMTYQQKQQLIKKSKREQEKLMNKKFKEQKKKEDEEKKRYKIYPPIISTMLKRLRRIDPFSGIFRDLPDCERNDKKQDILSVDPSNGQ